VLGVVAVVVDLGDAAIGAVAQQEMVAAERDRAVAIARKTVPQARIVAQRLLLSDDAAVTGSAKPPEDTERACLRP
jgi:hypothetical protein